MVNKIKLTNARQQKEKHVIDYIHWWRNISLDCKDRLIKTYALDMCIQGIHQRLRCILQGITPKPFEELATQALNMKLSIVAAKNS